MDYTLGFKHADQHLIDVSITTTGGPEPLRLFLPRWRPGRYEFQNFAQYLADFRAVDENGAPLEWRMLSSHCWEVKVPEEEEARISYRFYAAETNAGSSYVDAESIYINGITLLLYQKERINSPCRLFLELPSGYQIGGGLPDVNDGYHFENFHQLVDTPFLAARDLLHHQFEVRNIPFHLWFWGPVDPDLNQIETDMRAYTEVQLELFGEFPVSSYHYMMVMLHHKFRHGVEHHNSTVIAMGPSWQLMTPAMYKSFIEICSHELFHTWNVKALRPVDMLPYDYDRENYTELHYVTEGITTYYGDLMIWKGGRWSLENWLGSINKELQTHYQTAAHQYISLTEASWRSWTHGYQNAVMPNRKISFYTKGYLVALLLDYTIRVASKNQHNLDDVLRFLYHQLAKKGQGYDREAYQQACEKFAGRSLEAFFTDYIDGTAPLEPALAKLGDYFGFELREMPHGNPSTARWGLTLPPDGSAKIENIIPDSPAHEAGLAKGDELVAINGLQVSESPADQFSVLDPQKAVQVHFFRLGRLHETVLENAGAYVYAIPQFYPINDPAPRQLRNREAWQEVRTSQSVIQ